MKEKYIKPKGFKITTKISFVWVYLGYNLERLLPYFESALLNV